MNAKEILKKQCGTDKFRFNDIELIERSEYDVIYAMEEFAKEKVKEALKLNDDRFNSGLSEQEIFDKLGL